MESPHAPRHLVLPLRAPPEPELEPDDVTDPPQLPQWVFALAFGMGVGLIAWMLVRAAL